MPMESFLSEEPKGRLTEKFGIIANSFDHNVLTTLALACDEGYVTSARLRYYLNLHKSEISDMLKLMTEKGLLVSEGYGRGTRYVLPINGIDVLREDPYNVATSGSNVATSDPNVATSDPNVATSGSNVATSVKKKMSREELQELILQNCQEWISLEDLAKLIHRNPIYLRNHVMPILLAANKIQMLYPKNHPNQLYKVKD